MLRLPFARRLPDAIVREIDPLDLARVAAIWAAQGHESHALLDSALPGDPWSRWSVLALEPARSLAFDAVDARPWRDLDHAWFEGYAVAAISGKFFASDQGGLVPPFRGGFMVALSYDAARHLDDFAPWAERAVDDLAWPAFDVRLVGDLIATHAPTGRTFLVTSTHPVFGPTEERIERLEATLDRLWDASEERGVADAPADSEREDIAPTPARGATLRSNMSDAEYARAFDRLQEYLRAGDLYQANLTRRFDATYTQGPSVLYTNLRAAAPAPYAAWFAARWGHALSASPELFLAREGDRLVTRPIKGTRPRRADPAADAAEAAALVASEKDRAEHVMIVDVHRNDLGRVCKYGSVHVETLAGLEAFPTVHHLTSTVVGTTSPGLSPWHAIWAAFPAGSITGAPKRRAMEVIEELEPTRRGLYCGSMGWIGFDGDFALNVAIRTILLRGEEATFQAGGGIVIDSDCATEAEETWNKARALYAAVESGVPE